MCLNYPVSKVNQGGQGKEDRQEGILRSRAEGTRKGTQGEGQHERGGRCPPGTVRLPAGPAWQEREAGRPGDGSGQNLQPGTGLSPTPVSMSSQALAPAVTTRGHVPASHPAPPQGLEDCGANSWEHRGTPSSRLVG